MKRIGVATQHTTGGTSPASRQEVAPPTFSTISNCSFLQIHIIKLVSWPNTEEGWLWSKELRIITKYAKAIPRLKARPVVLRKVPLETNLVVVVTQHLDWGTLKSKYTSLNFEFATWTLFPLFRWCRGYQQASPFLLLVTQYASIVIITSQSILIACFLLPTFGFKFAFHAFWHQFGKI